MKHTAFIILSLVLLAACGKKMTKTEELIELKKQRAELDQKIAAIEAETSRNDSTKMTAVSIMELTPQSFSSNVEVQAVITGDEAVNATPQASGVVRNILVRVGQRVGKGQTLAILDAAAIQQQIQSMDAQLSLAKTVYERQQKLWSQNIGTQVQLLQAKSNYESLLNQKQALVAQKEMYTIKSPISGVVDVVGIKEGDMAMPGGSGILVVSKDRLKATASLGENYLGKVQVGDPVVLVFPDLNDSLRTKISHITQTVNPLSRAFNVEVKLGTNNRLHPNMSARMKIANYENASALVVPVSAIQKTGEGDMVYVAEGGKARAVVIMTGKNSNGMVEVLGGLKAGDRIITAGFEDLENGERIAVK